MQRKLKVTGFARFFLVMIFVAPIAYLGASYYNGEDGIANIKRFFGIEQRDESSPTPDVKNMDENAMKKELEYQQKRLDELKKENERLRKEVYEKEQELTNLKAQ
jgi:cell shape-determining protein MreC